MKETTDKGNSDQSEAHVHSAQVMTVLGPVPSTSLGTTLMHEHILNDCLCWWHKPTDSAREYLAEGPVRMEILSELKQDPFVNRDNISLNDEQLAIQELKQFVHAGGVTVVDPTCRGIGRNPEALVRIAKQTGLQIVMGAGYYLQSSHPAELSGMSVGDVADQLVSEAVLGVDNTGVRIGLIGEIGVSSDFTAEEEKSLRGAAQAQVRTGLPLMVHLPGWFRLAHRVLDIVEEEGASMAHTVLCHMNPSHDDFTYQCELAERGAFIEYDMIGMDYFYADQQVQCPSDDEVAKAIVKLIDAGHLDKLLLSQDVFLKMMLTHYGGNGYAFVVRHFLPRLKRLGCDNTALTTLMCQNPRRVFDASA